MCYTISSLLLLLTEYGKWSGCGVEVNSAEYLMAPSSHVTLVCSGIANELLDLCCAVKDRLELPF